MKTKAEQFGLGFEVIAELKFNIDNTYRCHKQKSMDIEVDFIRFECLKVDECLTETPKHSGSSSR